MRVAASLLVLLSAVALPVAAHADTDDTFSVTGHMLDLTFTLPHSPTPDSHDPHQDFALGDISFTENGVLMTADDVYFYTKNVGGGFELDDSSGAVIDGLSFYGKKLFTGTVSHPTFKEGDFRLTGGPACTVETDVVSDAAATCHYSLTIAPTAVSATPEPGSLVLLGSGALAAMGVVRRRFAR